MCSFKYFLPVGSSEQTFTQNRFSQNPVDMQPSLKAHMYDVWMFQLGFASTVNNEKNYVKKHVFI